MVKTRTDYDAIVIGGGHNGLVAAAYLAKARLKVLVLEARGVLGGAAASEEVFPGFKVNTGACDSGLFLPEIVSDLRLQKRGLKFLSGPAIVHAPQPDGDGLTLWRDPKKAAAEIAGFSTADAARYPAYLRWLSRMTGALSSVMTKVPPSIPDLSPGELMPWLGTALKVRRLGRKDMVEMLRALPMPVSDFLDEWFENHAVKAALGASGVTGSLLGPRASGTVFMLLYQALNAGPAALRASSTVKGGMGALSQALADAIRSYGGEIRTGAAVTQIMLENGRARGVALQSGEQVSAAVVLSSANPRRTFFEMVGAQNLPLSFVREVKNIRYRGGLARINLALSGLPAFTSLSGLPGSSEVSAQLGGHILICPSLDYLEQASDDAKYGQFSRRPMLDIMIPTLSDDTLAPPGQHLIHINVQYAPYHLQGENWDVQREALAERVLSLLEEYAPGTRQLILHQQVLTPLDLEREYGLVEGCIFHGQMAMDQLLIMRPVAGFGQYSTPVENLFLCGAGSHPGGGVTGAPGRNAARRALQRFNPA